MVRIKRRYFVFHLHFHSSPTILIKSSDIQTTFESMINRLYGDVGVARFLRNLSVISYNSSTQIVILRCLRDDQHLLRTAATFISKLNNNEIECSIQTLHIAGTIRQCKKYLINYSIEQLLDINSQLNHQNKITTTSQTLFKKKKMKTNKCEIDQRKLTLQKLLVNSRIELNK